MGHNHRWKERERKLYCKQTENEMLARPNPTYVFEVIKNKLLQPLWYWLRHHAHTHTHRKGTREKKPPGMLRTSKHNNNKINYTYTRAAQNNKTSSRNIISKKEPNRRKCKQTIYHWKLISNGVCRIFSLSFREEEEKNTHNAIISLSLSFCSL